MTDDIKKNIEEDYQNGVSPLGLSLKYNIEVAEVFEALKQGEMNHVVFVGDQVDPDPLTEVNGPKVQRVPYTKN